MYLVNKICSKGTFFKSVLIILFYLSSIGKSQEILFINYETGHPIKYCEINMNNQTLFSDNSGKLVLPSPAVIEISDNRFEYKKLKIANDTIVKLNRNVIQLPPIEITNQIVIIENKRKRSNYTNLPKGIEVGYWVQNKGNKLGKIQNIKIELKDKKKPSELLKFDFYDQNLVKLNDENIIIPISDIIKNNLIYLNNRNIFISGEKFLISLRVIENVEWNPSATLEDSQIKFINSKNKGNTLFRINSLQNWREFGAESYIPYFKIEIKQ